MLQHEQNKDSEMGNLHSLTVMMDYSNMNKQYRFIQLKWLNFFLTDFVKELLEGSIKIKEYRKAVYNKKGELNRKYKWDTNISMEEVNGAEGGQDVSKLS